MNRASWLAAVLIFAGILTLSASSAFGLAEAGLGVMAPGGDGEMLGKIVFVPNVTLSLFLLGVELDAWVSPGNNVFYVLPFLLLRVPLPIVTVYGGIGPRFWGSSTGFNLMPPVLELNFKVGAKASVMPLISAYGEAVARFLPLQEQISGVSLVIGARIGF